MVYPLLPERPDIIPIFNIVPDMANCPECSSYYLLKMNFLKLLYLSFPVLMLTAINTKMPMFHFSPDTDGEYMPVDAFLDKPVNADELLHKVGELLK